MTTQISRFSTTLALMAVAAFSLAAVALGGAYVTDNGVCTPNTDNVCADNTCSIVSGITLNGQEACYAYSCTNDTVSDTFSFCKQDSSSNNRCSETFSNDTTDCTLTSCLQWTCQMNLGTCTTSAPGGGDCRCPAAGGVVPKKQMYRLSKCTQT